MATKRKYRTKSSAQIIGRRAARSNRRQLVYARTYAQSTGGTIQSGLSKASTRAGRKSIEAGLGVNRKAGRAAANQIRAAKGLGPKVSRVTRAKVAVKVQAGISKKSALRAGDYLTGSTRGAMAIRNIAGAAAVYGGARALGRSVGKKAAKSNAKRYVRSGGASTKGMKFSSGYVKGTDANGKRTTHLVVGVDSSKKGAKKQVRAAQAQGKAERRLARKGPQSKAERSAAARKGSRKRRRVRGKFA